METTRKIINPNYKEKTTLKTKLKATSNEPSYWFLDENQNREERLLYDRDAFEGHPDDFGSK